MKKDLKIKALISLLEKYSSKKVVLKEGPVTNAAENMPQITITRVKVAKTKEIRFNKMERGVISFFPQGETVLDNLENRRIRPYQVYKTKLGEVLQKASETNPKLATYKPTDFKWSQTAGCSCGCSPGFIIATGSFPYNIFVDYK